MINTNLLKKKKAAACKNSISGGRISYVPISKKCLESPEDLPIIYDPIMTMVGFTLTFSVLLLLNCLMNIDPLKTISIETPQAA